MENKPKVIIIGGPTATGKTRLSLDIAKAFGGEIVSADSVQIYKRLDIGSAKPSKEEMEGIPHHMIDILEPTEEFSVYDFVNRAKADIEDILSRGRLPIVVGGTGLYISSLVDNVSFTPNETDMALRAELFERTQKTDPQTMHIELSNIDPVAAEKIHPNNIRRVIRALEIFYLTGKTMTEQNELSKTIPSPYEYKMYALTSEREIIYDRINRRVDEMVKRGLFEEVSSLLSSGVAPHMQSMQGIGYKEIAAFFRGELLRDEAVDAVKQNSRRYAKRQLTWFKRDTRYKWLDITNEIDISELI